ncbi:uncharacterized protein LOC129752803 [Uranotaenia lowii]|uniref:uncharacterized protein LOC129752803 n=1 Tax=Uranotaenia lowii TaxID=190385 RepID=UPI00247877F2|nr:uncharacterized protein LOC129752803 [Uranotaenia lowii]
MGVGEDELPSLEYIEDPYIPKLDNCITPSLDDINDFNPEDDDLGDEQTWPDETELYLRSLTLDQILGVSSDEEITDPEVELQTVETEFSPPLPQPDQLDPKMSPNRTGVGVVRSLFAGKLLNRGSGARSGPFKLFNKKHMRDVRVTFIDFSKPYLARISSGDNYKSFLNIGSAGIDKKLIKIKTTKNFKPLEPNFFVEKNTQK